MRHNNRGDQRPQKRAHKLNREIRYPEVRITGDGIESRVVSIQDAQRLANEMDVDMMLISEDAKPPVVKLVDYNKYLYEQKRRQKDQQKNSKKNQVKELRLGADIGEHDFEFKKRHAINWLEGGDSIKAIIFFKGRNIVHKDKGELILLKMADALSEVGVAESMPKLEGKRMFMNIKPKPVKSS